MRLILSTAFCVFLSGCAVNYIDASGANHTWGLVHVVQKKIENDNNAYANIHQVEALGAYFISMEQQSSIGIGYTKTYEISVSEDEAISFSMDKDKPGTIQFESTQQLLQKGKVNDAK